MKMIFSLKRSRNSQIKSITNELRGIQRKKGLTYEERLKEVLKNIEKMEDTFSDRKSKKGIPLQKK